MEKYHDIGGKLSHRKGAPNDKEFGDFSALIHRQRTHVAAARNSVGIPPRRQRNAPNGTSRADMERP